ncbi:MAG: aminotransferase class I/II-fold pyridoxal phosphate-dependent enzyme [Ruminococcus callidus]
MLPCLEQYPHVLVLKSLTKLYAIPGLRLGYGLCVDTELVEKIRQTGQPWPVNTLAEEAGIAALHAEEYREKSLSFCRTSAGGCTMNWESWDFGYGNPAPTLSFSGQRDAPIWTSG